MKRKEKDTKNSIFLFEVLVYNSQINSKIDNKTVIVMKNIKEENIYEVSKCI